MAWDFSTDPEHQRKLEWARDFVRTQKDRPLAGVRVVLADWGHVFNDTTVAAAILDRLLHHATVLAINGDSYRMRAHRDAINTLRPAITGGEFS